MPLYFSTEKQMEKLDMLAVKQGLEIRQMMELAGWHMLILFKILKISSKQKITIVCGVGNKGGDGLSAARHLINHGYKVTTVMLSKKISPDAQHHLMLLQKMKAPVVLFSSPKAKLAIKNGNVIIDGLIGYHLNGAPRGKFAEVIELMNAAKGKIIAYDLPTGVDPTTGECYEPCVKAKATLTLALPKRIFKTKEGKKYSGQVWLADIGIPAFLYNQVKKGSRPQFEKSKEQLIEVK